MTELTKAELDAIQIMIQLYDTGLPDGAVLELYNAVRDEWEQVSQAFYPPVPFYRIKLPKPAPHPTLLSIVEHGCFQRGWVKWFAVDEDGRVCAFANKPYIAGHKWLWKDRSQYINLFQLPATQPNWAQQCWTLQEIRDIIKQNTAQQGSITQNTVKLSTAEKFCYAFYEHPNQPNVEVSSAEVYGIGKRIGERIAAQRKEAQS